ncbi:MAG: hypothetical protein ABI847_12875 [Anaerolineales bacterium]
MTALDRLASALNRRDEVPNQELARDLAQRKDKAGIKEVAAGLRHSDPAIQADCIKVLYEIGAIEPKLIGPYAAEFVRLLTSKNNRLVWGGMTALAAIAETQAAALFQHLDAIKAATDAGSVITSDQGVRTLARMAAGDDARRRAIFPYLLIRLARARPKDVPQHAEQSLRAVDAASVSFAQPERLSSNRM